MFREELKSLTERVPGARGALIMGLDGIAVDRFLVEDEGNLETLGAEYLSVVKKFAETHEELGIGRIQELSMVTESLFAVFMSVTEEYFLVVAVPPNGNLGRARYEARKSSLRLEKPGQPLRPSGPSETRAGGSAFGRPAMKPGHAARFGPSGSGRDRGTCVESRVPPSPGSPAS